MNPYLAGFFLGLVLLAAIFVTGRGLGASGAIKSIVVATVDGVASTHAEQSSFYGSYVGVGKDNPLKTWLVFEIAGVLIGGFLSGLISGRLKFVSEGGPRISPHRRWLFAAIGGALFSIGAQFARGCTSGAALTGMAVLSTAGFITMMAIFGSGYVIAYFFRKLWI